MRIGILEGLKEMVQGLMRFLLGMVLFLLPTFAICLLGKCIFADSSEAFAFGVVLCLPAMGIGAWLVGILQHSCRAIQYAKEHDCDIRQAFKATELTHCEFDDY